MSVRLDAMKRLSVSAPFFDCPVEAVSVHVAGADWRYESRAVMAGMPSFLPIAHKDGPSTSCNQTTSSRRKMRFGRPTTFPAA